MKPKLPRPPEYAADPPDLTDSPTYWLAVLSAARRAKDRLLEYHARQHLDRLGVRIVFYDDCNHEGEGGHE